MAPGPPVEGATDRHVLAYMSQVHSDPNVAVELFILEPAKTDSADGAGPQASAQPA